MYSMYHLSWAIEENKKGTVGHATVLRIAREVVLHAAKDDNPVLLRIAEELKHDYMRAMYIKSCHDCGVAL